VLLQVVFHAQLAAEEGRFNIDDVCRAVSEKLIRRHPHVFGELAVDGSGEVLRNWEQIKLAERARKQAAAALKAPADAPTDTHPPAPSPIFKGIPRHMPALQRAARVQEKAARVGFDWATLAPVLAKVREEWAELEAELTRVGVADAGNPHLDEARVEAQRGDAPPPPIAEQQLPPEVAEEFGDLLFALTNAARFLRIEPEQALRAATDKFMTRYSMAETMARREGHDWHALSLDEMDAWWNKAKQHERLLASAPPKP
jgi:ATP diphosphatase